MSAAFPRHARVRTGAEYARVFEQSRRTSDPLLSLHWLAGEQPARLGMAVSRKVDRRAVGRNRIKRQLREQFRSLRSQLPGGDYVVVARPPAAAASNAQLRATFLRVLTRAGALPPPATVGTMPAALNSPSSPSTTPEPDAG
ncbi:ribonuclease P protein component [Pseudoxanthomonas sp. 22568]|jgi:ribonuclease P protein component|uniref:ribonuclease P protein component n=1 Tax=Pseudoxanthomonas TaxID=83618 RepID=UPI00193BBAD7|nr:ribonuclease P protein component [Pseudoxanthomonas beigongshangi]UBB25085.1 ribonuclease P protein component [Pseudoxanthomonas japonensis]